jgi:hypothetical protein
MYKVNVHSLFILHTRYVFAFLRSVTNRASEFTSRAVDQSGVRKIIPLEDLADGLQAGMNTVGKGMQTVGKAARGVGESMQGHVVNMASVLRLPGEY